MQRKLIKVGTSAGVLIPKATMEEQRMKIGDTVEVEIGKKSRYTADPDLLMHVEKLMKRYEPMLKKLVSS